MRSERACPPPIEVTRAETRPVAPLRAFACVGVAEGVVHPSRDKRLATHTEGHPIDYLNFEGRIQRGEYNRLLIDLDPPDDGWAGELRRTAREIRDLLSEVGLVRYVQATGGRGFHVVAPLDGEGDCELVRPLARDIAEQLADKHPDHLTTEQRKDQCGKRIFLDTNPQRAYGQTMICPYSLRARSRAPAATPLEWTELGESQPDGRRLGNLPRRVAQQDDPWLDMADHTGSAAAARRRLHADRDRS